MLDTRKATLHITSQLINNILHGNMKITTQLRLVFITIVTLTIVAAIVNSNQLIELSKSQKQSSDLTIPALTASRQLESQLARYLDLSYRLQNISDFDQIANIHGSMKTITYNLEEIVLTSNMLKLTQETKLSILENLKLLNKSSESIALASTELGKLNIALDEGANLIELSNTNINSILSPEIIKLNSEIEKILAPKSQNNPHSLDSLNSTLHSLFYSHAILSKLQLTTTSIIERTASLAKQRNYKKFADIDSNIRFSFNSAIQILFEFENSPFRLDLATHFKSLYNSLMANNGILNNLSQYELHVQQQKSAALEQTEITIRLSLLIDTIVTQANNNSDASIEHLNRTLFNTILILLLTTSAIVVVVVIVNTFIIEKMINKRMVKLTEAVLTIANGQTDKEFDIQGNDEIGVMAKSLDVFRNNAKELIRSNHELEQFAYAASHDLKSPLRAIESLAQWTIDDFRDELNTEVKSNLEKILERTHRLSTLQTDLLNYSKAGKIDSSIGPFKIADEIKQLNELLNPNNNFHIVYKKSEFETIFTHATPLRQILLNFITNAIKHHDKNNGTIEISTQMLQNRIFIQIRDDGPGIDPKYHQRIFELFQGLQSRDVVEGSGLGLSIVNKLVTYYGGEVSVDSNPAERRGTTFSFDWPCNNSRKIAA